MPRCFEKHQAIYSAYTGVQLLHTFLHPSRVDGVRCSIVAYESRLTRSFLCCIPVYSRWDDLYLSRAFSHFTYICKRCHWQTSISATNHWSFFSVLGRHVCSPTQVRVTPARVRLWGAFYDKSRMNTFLHANLGTNTLRFYGMRYCKIGSSLGLSRTWCIVTQSTRALPALQTSSFKLRFAMGTPTWSLIGPTNVVISIW